MSKKQIVLVIGGVGQVIWLAGAVLFVAGFFFGAGASGWPFFALGIAASLPFSIAGTHLTNRWGIKWGKPKETDAIARL